MRKTIYKLTLLVLLTAVFCGCKEEVYYGNWRSISTLNAKGRASAPSFVIDNHAYIVGGHGFYFVPTIFNATWAFDTEDYSWSECDTLPGAPRRSGVAFAIDGKGYYCGGIGYGGEYFSNLYEFDPEKTAGSQWTEMKADTFPDGGFYDAISFVIDGIAYVGTGVRSALGTSGKYYRFDPSKPEGSRWSMVESAKDAAGRQGASVFVIGSRAYILGGRSNNYRVASFECYDAATDEFFVISENMLDDYNIDKLYRYNASAFSIGNDGYLTCGVKFTGEVLRDTWRYTPDGGKGKWQMIGDFEGSNRYSATCFVAGRYGFLLCGQNGNFSTSFKDDVWLFSPDEEYNRRKSK